MYVSTCFSETQLTKMFMADGELLYFVDRGL